MTTSDEFLPIAKRLTRRAMRGNMRGDPDRDDVIAEEAQSLAYTLAEAANTRLVEVAESYRPRPQSRSDGTL
jgi:hypothetical protein